MKNKRRFSAQMAHLREMITFLNNWDFYTSLAKGFGEGQVRFIGTNMNDYFTKEQLINHIERTKMNIRRTLNGNV